MSLANRHKRFNGVGASPRHCHQNLPNEKITFLINYRECIRYRGRSTATAILMPPPLPRHVVNPSEAAAPKRESVRGCLRTQCHSKKAVEVASGIPEVAKAKSCCRAKTPLSNFSWRLHREPNRPWSILWTKNHPSGCSLSAMSHLCPMECTTSYLHQENQGIRRFRKLVDG